MAPVDSFPSWLQPFVRYQPVSQVTETLRGFATGNVIAINLATSIAWCLGLPRVRCHRTADATADAMTTTTAEPKTSLAAESVAFAGRLITRWRRHPIVPIQSLLFPTFLLITYDLLVGKSVTRITGTDSLDGLVPAVRRCRRDVRRPRRRPHHSR
jgi:ABC-2 type transport system permease protein